MLKSYGSVTLELSEAFGNKLSFVIFNDHVRPLLDFVDPFVAIGSFAKRKRLDAPCPIFFEGMHFCSHNITSSTVPDHFTKILRLRITIKSN